MDSTSDKKRGRDDVVPDVKTKPVDRRGRRQFDPAWYGDVGEGDHSALVSDDLFGLTVSKVQLSRGRQGGNQKNQQAGDASASGGTTASGAPGGAAHQRMLRMKRKDDAWERRVMEAGGVLEDGAGDGGDDYNAGQQEQPPEVQLEVNEKLNPPFLENAATGDFSRQQQIIIPLKDKQSKFAELAKKGSEALGKHKHAKRERQQKRDLVDMEDSDLTALLKNKDDEMTEEELERLRRRERQQQRMGASEQELLELKKQEDERNVESMKQQSSMKKIGDATATDRIKIAEVRRKLPIYQCRSELLRYVGEHPVSIIMGETGSGKTTQLVQYLYEEGFAENGLIGCTQPRRMAAVGVAARVSDEIGDELGTTVGYAIRLEDETSKDTKIKFMTDGVLLREIVQDPLVRKYSCIVLDEAHERSVNTDVLLGVLKDVLRKRADFKLVVTSASMDIGKFTRFFNNAPYYEIPGSTYNVKPEYVDVPIADYVEEVVLKIMEIHLTEKEGGDILVFMTGKDDINAVCEMVKERLTEQINKTAADSIEMLPCYSELPGDAQLKILSPAPPGKRKCVVSTNVAETSLTIDGIKFVIDPGLMKTNVFIPNIGMNTLQMYPVSQAQAKQRMGRAGRTQDGVCYRLYTDQQYQAEMLVAAVPEIQRSSIDSVVLLLKSIGVTDLLQFDFIDPPPEVNLRSSLKHLWMLGALSDRGVITTEGALMLEFPTEPMMAKVLVKSAEFGCGEEILGVIAMMNGEINTVFTVPPGREEDARAAHEKFHNPESDHLTFYNVLAQYIENGRSDLWARDHFINPVAIARANNIRTQFYECMTRNAKLPVASCNYDTDRVRECLAQGYFVQSARRKQWTEYSTLLTGVPCHVHESSALHSGGGIMPDYVIYHTFMLTTKEYMSSITAVRGEWLAAASRGVITVKGDQKAKFQSMLTNAQEAAVFAQNEKEKKASLFGRNAAKMVAQKQKEGQKQLAKRKKVNL